MRGSVFEQGKDYIARITGTDPKFGLAREFLGSKKDASRNGRTWSRAATVTTPGLYELSSTGKRGAERAYAVVLEHPEEGLVRILASSDSAHELAKDIRQVERLQTRRKEDGKLTFRGEDGKLILGGDGAKTTTEEPEMEREPLSGEKAVQERPDPHSTREAMEHRFLAHTVEKSQDVRRRAKRVIPVPAKTSRDRDDLIRWQADPSTMDVEGVDTPGSETLKMARGIKEDASRRYREARKGGMRRRGRRF